MDRFFPRSYDMSSASEVQEMGDGWMGDGTTICWDGDKFGMEKETWRKMTTNKKTMV